MKIYCITDRNWEYNDNFYEPRAGSNLVKAFRDRDNAVVEMERMNAEKREKGDECRENEDYYSRVVSWYELKEVEVESDEVEYATTKRKLAKAREDWLAAAKKVFHAGARALFEKHPALESFGWTQYTPYFNDGDVCKFRVNSYDPTINGLDEEELYEQGGTKWDHKANKEIKLHEPTAVYLCSEPVQEFLESIDEDTMEALFGDHAEVTVFRDGQTEVEQYDHD